MDIVTAKSAGELLLALPHLAGNEIANSVVVVPFHGSRSGVAARIDLPVGIPPATRASWARSLLAPMVEIGADAIALFVVTDDEIGTGALPHRGIVSALLSVARRHRLPVRASLCHAADAWGDYAEPQSARGPLAELELIGTLEYVAPVQAPGLPVPAAASVRSAVAALMATLEQEWASAVMHDACVPFEACRSFPPENPDARCIVTQHPMLAMVNDHPPLVLELALQRAVLPLEAQAMLIVLMQSPTMRDVATTQWLDGLAAGEFALDSAQAFHRDGVPISDATARRLAGEGAAPDHERLSRAVGLMESLVAVAPSRHQTPLLTILGSLHWYLGRAGTAERCFRVAIDSGRGDSMARLMIQLVTAGRLPDWVSAARRHRATA